MLFNAKEQTLTIANIQMDYITFGKGTKPLIMIQGLNTNGIKGSAVPLSIMYKIFAKDYKVYLFDRRKDLPENVTVRELSADIALAMDYLGLKNADVFGVSLGGMIAQYLAIERPDLVNKLVLAVTLSRNNETVEHIINDWICKTKQADWKSLVNNMAEKMYSDEYIRKYKMMLPLLTVIQKPKDVNRFITLAKACLTCDTFEMLDKIKRPVFVIGGAKDQIVTSQASEEIAKKLGCELYLYEELGHAAYEEAKDFNKKVYKFLKG